jgi:hypothetical protein
MPRQSGNVLAQATRLNIPTELTDLRNLVVPGDVIGIRIFPRPPRAGIEILWGHPAVGPLVENSRLTSVGTRMSEKQGLTFEIDSIGYKSVVNPGLALAIRTGQCRA